MQLHVPLLACWRRGCADSGTHGLPPSIRWGRAPARRRTPICTRAPGRHPASSLPAPAGRRSCSLALVGQPVGRCGWHTPRPAPSLRRRCVGGTHGIARAPALSGSPKDLVLACREGEYAWLLARLRTWSAPAGPLCPPCSRPTLTPSPRTAAAEHSARSGPAPVRLPSGPPVTATSPSRPQV